MYSAHYNAVLLPIPFFFEKAFDISFASLIVKSLVLNNENITFFTMIYALIQSNYVLSTFICKHQTDEYNSKILYVAIFIIYIM